MCFIYAECSNVYSVYDQEQYNEKMAVEVKYIYKRVYDSA